MSHPDELCLPEQLTSSFILVLFIQDLHQYSFLFFAPNWIWKRKAIKRSSDKAANKTTAASVHMILRGCVVVFLTGGFLTVQNNTLTISNTPPFMNFCFHFYLVFTTVALHHGCFTNTLFEVVIKAAIISIIMYCIAKMTCCNLISGKLERVGSPELSGPPQLFRLLSAFCFGPETQLEFFTIFLYYVSICMTCKVSPDKYTLKSSWLDCFISALQGENQRTPFSFFFFLHLWMIVNA